MHPLRPVAALAFAVLLISASAASAQGQATRAQSAPAPGPESSQTGLSPTASSTVLHTGANLVLVDVVVTDKGSAVHGLDQKRFRVYEDGHVQPIASFDEHQPPVASASSAAIAARLATLPPHTYTNIPVYPDAGAVNVLLLDGLNTPMANQQEARLQMIEYMGTIKPGTSMAIFTLSSQLRMVEGFTTNVAELARVMKDKKVNPQQSALISPQGNSAQRDIEDELATMETSSDAPPDANVVSALLQFEADLTATQTDIRVRTTLDAMQQLARYLSAIPGRKNLIWFSGSFPITLDPDPDQPLPFLAERTYADDIRKTSELLAAARVAVYPVDARGLMTQTTADAAYSPSAIRVTATPGGKATVHGNAMNDSNVVHDYDTFMTQTQEEHGSMQQIAAETGGTAAINTNDLKEAVANAVENGSSYYTIGYVPSGKKFNGHYHRLKLAVDNGGYKLAYRTGYYADPSDKPNEHNPGAATLITSATLHGAPSATQILFRAEVLSATDPSLAGVKFQDGPAGDMTASLKGPPQRYVVGLDVDPHSVAFDATPDGMHAAQLEFVLVAYDADGKRVNYVDHGYGFNLKPDRYASIMDNGIRARLAIDMPAGLSYLRIAVQDLTAGRAGALEVPVIAASK